MKRHAGKKGVNPQWQLFELLRRDLWHWASFVVNECFYLDVAPTTSQLPSCRPLLDRRIGCTQDSFQEVFGASGSRGNTPFPPQSFSPQSQPTCDRRKRGKHTHPGVPQS